MTKPRTSSNEQIAKLTARVVELEKALQEAKMTTTLTADDAEAEYRTSHARIAELEQELEHKNHQIQGCASDGCKHCLRVVELDNALQELEGSLPCSDETCGCCTVIWPKAKRVLELLEETAELESRASSPAPCCIENTTHALREPSDGRSLYLRCDKHDRREKLAEDYYADHEGARRTEPSTDRLMSYVGHLHDCMHDVCMAEIEPGNRCFLDGERHVDGNEDTAGHDYAPKGCTCGLSEVLASQPASAPSSDVGAGE